MLPNRGCIAVTLFQIKISITLPSLRVCDKDMETERRNKRKQSPGLRDPNVPIKCIIGLPAPNATSGGNFNCLSPKMAIKCIIAVPAPNATSGGNSNCLSPKMTANKCEKEVTRVSGLPPRAPIKLSPADEEIHVKHESPSKSQIKFGPKVVADSPSSRDQKGDSSGKSPCGNSNCLSPKMTANKCEKEVTRVSGLPPRAPIKLSAIDEEIDVNHETPSKSQIKFKPRVVADSPSSRDEKGDSSGKSPCSKRLYIPSHCIQTKTMRIYTKGGFCFTRKVRKYIEPESTEL